jgi:hypothetical protein
MRYLVACFTLLIALPVAGYAQLDQKSFKKESPLFEQAINRIAESILPVYGVKQPAHAAYVEGCGPIFFVEVQFERAENPFASPPPAAEVKKNMERGLAAFKEKMMELLKKRFFELTAASDGGSLTVVTNVFNSNPAYAPNIPTQVVFIAKRDLASVDVAIHEYNFDPTAK